MKENQPLPNEYLVGAKKDAEGNIDTSRAMSMHVDDEAMIKAEQKRNVKDIRNLTEVFGGMELTEDDQHLSLLFQEQSPLITKYLKKDTRGGEGGEIYNQMAPGIAMLGFELARSGFGRSEINSGDPKFDEELERIAKNRYKAAESVFNQLLNKMYPEGTSSGDVLLRQLEVPQDEAANQSIFLEIKNKLQALYEKGLPDSDEAILKYQNELDFLIEQTGDALGESAETNAKLGVEGKITPEEQSARQTDMLTLVMTLKELQELRKESVRKKMGSNAYDNISPVEIKRIEDLERRIKTPKQEADEDAQEKGEVIGELMTFTNPAIGAEEGDEISGETQTKVLISNKRLINATEAESGGAGGIVYVADVQLPGVKERHQFVIKELHKPDPNVIKNYNRAKEVGLKVWKTYRASENGQSILMSSGDTENWKVVGDKNTLSQQERAEFFPISNYESFLTDYYREAEKASEHRIAVAGDVPFFRVRKSEIDFILGDYELLEESNEDANILLHQNIQNMHARLAQFFEKNFGDEAEMYIKQSETYVQTTFQKHVKRYGGDAKMM
ncbi:hypothetical protein KKG22_05685 [Patescibacteria group bacterium]|nr:hypothetical protein [Patescibacteria group bacterium]